MEKDSGKGAQRVGLGVGDADQPRPRWLEEMSEPDFRPSDEWWQEYRAARSKAWEDGQKAYRFVERACALLSASQKAKRRRASLANTIKRAEKAGKTVTSVTTPDGMTLIFGEPQAAPRNDLDNWLAKRHAN